MSRFPYGRDLRPVDPRGKLIPTRVLLIAQGGYSPQVRRAYEARSEIDHINELGEIVERSRQTGQSVNMMQLGSVSGKILQPSARIDKEITIRNGWDEPRFSFMIEFSMILTSGKEYIYTYSGFTDYVGATWNGHIDPQMTLHITSVFGYANMVSRHGVAVTSARSDNNIIVAEHHYGDASRPLGVEMNNNRTLIPRGASYDFLLDPSSIYVAHRRSEALESSGIGGRTITHGDGIVSNRAVTSMRGNANPSYFLSQMINHVGNSAQYRDNQIWGEGVNQDDSFLRAGELDRVTKELKGTANRKLNEDPLFNLYGPSTNIASSASLTWGELAMNFPELDLDDSLVTIIFPPNLIQQGSIESAIANASYNGQNNHDEWRGSNVETMIATRIQQQIPALMMAEQIRSIRFTVTNMVDDPFSTERYGWILGDHERGAYDNRDALVFMINHDRDLGIRLYDNFRMRVDATLLDGMFPDDLVDFSIVVDADILSGCYIAVSVDGKPYQEFNSPFYMGATLSPYLTGHIETQNEIASTLVDVVESVIR